MDFSLGMQKKSIIVTHDTKELKKKNHGYFNGFFKKYFKYFKKYLKETDFWNDELRTSENLFLCKNTNPLPPTKKKRPKSTFSELWRLTKDSQQSKEELFRKKKWLSLNTSSEFCGPPPSSSLISMVVLKTNSLEIMATMNTSNLATTKRGCHVCPEAPSPENCCY